VLNIGSWLITLSPKDYVTLLGPSERLKEKTIVAGASENEGEHENVFPEIEQ
jgi:hypothetical protein